MKDLQAIARYMRLPDEQLRYPIELLNQGYEPIYLANYRPDELGSIDEQTLSILKRALSYSELLREHKERIEQTLQREQHWNETVANVVSQANTISQVDTVTRHLRARRNSRSISEKCPQVEAVGQAILTMQGEPPADLNAWVAEVASVPVEQAAHVLEQTKRWLQYLLSEDVRLIHDLQKTILKTASISIKVLPDPPKGSDAEKQLEHAEANGGAAPVPTEIAASPEVTATENTNASVDSTAEQAVSTEGSVTTENAAEEQPASEVNVDSTQSTESTADATTVAIASTESNDAAEVTSTTAEVAPLIAGFHQGRKPGKALKTKTLSEKQLSPRQRRRKWLRGILESYAKLKKPLRALTPYQILMLSRGQRSQIVAIQFHYDERGLIQACRESLSPGRHPLHRLLLEIAEDGLRNHILPRLHQDVFSILEEDAHTDLTEAAVVHLHSSLLQRPVRGHRILLIDAVGPKMAAVAIVDSDGEVVFTNEIPCNSNRADIVAQNVVLLGEWIHTHRVSLVAISNGPSRRYLIHTISELMKQSTEGSLLWTIVDRAGADAYCMSRGCLVELPSISRRHRAAVWLARRLQDPLKQILKVDPVRLRLGSYQRELPQKELEVALKDAVSAAITKAGVDVFHADVEVLKRIPGMNADAAKAIVAERASDKITSRESLMAILKEHLTEMQARQAIGFLKVYGSSNTLDGTTIHPDDYRLAERLIENASLTRPNAHPENWSKPDYRLLEAANAAAESHPESAEIAKAQEFGAMIDQPEATDSETTDAVEASSGDESVEVVSEASGADSDATEVSADASPAAEADTAEVASEQASEPAEATETTGEATATTNGSSPEVQNGPMVRPALSIDVERLARSWQVGREKMKRVANCLQFPFADSRDFQYPVPLQNKVPRLDSLPPGTMLNALVIGVADFGVFVDLGPDCSGLIHISRLAPEFIEDPHQFVQVGDIVPVWVLNVDEKRKRVSLTAIPPGTPTRRNESSGDHSGPQNRNANSGDRAPRGNDSRPPRTGERVGDRGRREGQGSGTQSQGGPNRQGQGAGRGAPSGNRPGGNRNGGKPPYGNRDRNRRDDRANEPNETQSKRQPRIEQPKPLTPITDAMQQGKEPLRSFSDLLQFMKQTKDEPVQNKPNTDGAAKVESKESSSDAHVASAGDSQNSSLPGNVTPTSNTQAESTKPDAAAPNVSDSTDTSSPA